MSYKALYRTYRPQIFSDVTGQEVVVHTLQNAIKNNKISHAYLFSGPRGTGKTSIARIFAKALNCTNLQVNEPCNECISCREISDGYNPDVIEIDAASNNGVDEIRDIREKVKFLPSGSKYKVYIIDEVHMLSGGAFNALLKTLEEPPKHAVFILATTEPQKLPATIISRCQRFEFKALSISEISERLKKICENEEVIITEEALNLIAESAEGAMRDAISILDQAISYGNKEITIDDINGVTGSLSFEKVINLSNAIDSKDVHSTIQQLNDLISSGKEVNKIINSLLVFYRDVLLYKSVGNEGYNKYIFSKQSFQDFCSNIAVSKIMYFIDILCDVQSKVKYSTTPNIFLEIALIKMCNISVEELDIMKRLTELEEKINNGNIAVNQGEYNPVDNEKVNTLELRINQVINELNKLEIRKQLEKINLLQQSISNITVSSSNIDEREIKNDIQYLKDKISEIELFANNEGKDSDDNLLEKIHEIENKLAELSINNSNNENNDVNNNIDLNSVYARLSYLENKEEEISNNSMDINNLFERVNILENKEQGNETPSSNTIDLEDIYARLNVLENKEQDNTTSNISNNDQMNYEISKIQETLLSIFDDINTLKEKVINNENKVYDYNEHNVDLTEMSNKLMFLEKRMYQIIAGELATHKNIKKEPKKNNGQIMLFGDEVLNINDLEQTKQNYDFGELQKEEKDIEIIEEVKPTENNEAIQKEEIIEDEVQRNEGNASEIIDNDNVQTEPIEEQQNENSFGKGLFESDIEYVNEEKNDIEVKEDPIVSKYFDVDKGQEVIQKEKSTLVVSEKKNTESTSSLEQDIIALEKNNMFDRVKQEVVIKEIEPVVVEETPKEKVVEKAEPKRDKFASYNIKDIEQLLHDSRSVEARNDKVRIEQVWKNMTRGARPEQLSIIETLQEGQVTAVGNKEFIVVFPNVSLCNIVMRRKFKDIAIRILYNLLGETYDYVALPTETWAMKSKEYKQQYAIGMKTPTLTPIEVAGLEIRNEDEYKTETDKIIDRTIKLFGEGNIDIE